MVVHDCGGINPDNDFLTKSRSRLFPGAASFLYIVLTMNYCVSIICLLLILNSCSNKPTGKLFTELTETETGINFRNLLKEDNPGFNIALYPYFYNGSGVAIGDINNDGLPDICFTGNMVDW